MLSALALGAVLWTTAADLTLPMAFDPPTVDVPTVRYAAPDGTTLTLAVDTGCAAPLVLDPRAARRLGIDVTDQPTEKRYGLTGWISKVPALAPSEGGEAASPFSFRNQEAFLVRLSSLRADRSVDGILGLPYLARYFTTIDYATHSLTLHDPSHPPTGGPEAHELPYALENQAMMVQVGFPAGISRMLLDTGRGVSELVTADRAKLDAKASVLARLSDLYSDRLTERLYTGGMRLAGLDLGPAALKLNPARGLLGNDVLRLFRLTLDAPRSRVILEYPKPGLRPSLPGDVGMAVALRDGRPVVTAVTANGAAQGVLQVGDVIGQIAGVDVSGLTEDRLLLLLEGEAETEARMTIVRKGAARTVAYTRRGMFDFVQSPQSTPSGLRSLALQSDGTWVVSAMLAKTPLWNADVRVGDWVTACNGTPLTKSAAETLPFIQKAVLSGKFDLTVRRGDAPPRVLHIVTKRPQ